MGTRKPSETKARRAARDASAEAGVRAALRARRRRRADEAGLQALVRRLATQSPGTSR